MEEEREVTSRSFRVNRHPLDMVTSFKYLDQVISAADDDWMAVFRNLAKMQAVWQRLTRIFIREGVAPRVSDFLFKSVVQLVLLLGAETWVVTPCMGRVLGGFQDQLDQRLTGTLPRRRHDGNGSTPWRQRKER